MWGERQACSSWQPRPRLTIDGKRFSLKTEAASAIKVKKLHVSKFMELGKGKWDDDPNDLIGLRNQFLEHLKSYERIITLRALAKGHTKGNSEWRYELVEIPKDLLQEAEHGKLEMKLNSTQMPKPGYCYVSGSGEEKFQLYFDGGSERKLQIKHLKKKFCTVHAEWRFSTIES